MDLRDFPSVIKSNRRFTTVKWVFTESFELEFYKKHGTRVQQLFLKIDKPVKAQQPKFIEMLSSLPKLKRYVVRDWSEKFKANPDADFPSFEKLETLELLHSDLSVLKCFKNSKLSTLKLLGLQDLKKENTNLLIEFFATQKHLKALALRSVHENYSELFEDAIANSMIPFRLEKLSLLNFRLSVFYNLINFMLLHAGTLEVLELSSYMPDEVFELMFSKFKKLRSLSVSLSAIPDELNYNDQLENNESVTTLVLHGEDFNQETVEDFFQHLPNVENLIVNDAQTEILELAAKHFIGIKHLKIDGFYEPRQHFPDLRTLHVTAFGDSLFGYMINPLETIDNSTRNTNLQELTIGFPVNGDEKFFEVIRRNCPKLKMLSIHKDSLRIDSSEAAGIKALRLHDDKPPRFCETEFWNFDDYDDDGTLAMEYEQYSDDDNSGQDSDDGDSGQDSDDDSVEESDQDSDRDSENSENESGQESEDSDQDSDQETERDSENSDQDSDEDSEDSDDSDDSEDSDDSGKDSDQDPDPDTYRFKQRFEKMTINFDYFHQI